MNQILTWLSGGDLRSDGASNEVADFVLQNPQLFGELIAGLEVSDDVIRGRTADALEKVARSRPDLLIDHLPKIIFISRTDPVPMVKMHLAMILGHLAGYRDRIDEIVPALRDLLGDQSVFAKSWAIASLCIVARMYPKERDQILGRIAPLERGDSAAIRSRVRKAVRLLTDDRAPFPKGWIKSKRLGGL